MNKLQKIALLNLNVATAGLLFQLLHLFMSNPIMRIVASLATFIFCSFLVASYIFRQMIAKQGSLHYDERDQLIHKRAALAGFITIFLVLFSAIMITLFVVGFGNSISIGCLLTIFLLGALSLFFAESIAILIQYGRGGKDGEK